MTDNIIVAAAVGGGDYGPPHGGYGYGYGYGYDYAQITDHYCQDTAGSSYSTRTQAEAACDADPACTSIYDAHCDGREGVQLCHDSVQSDLESSAEGSCVYWKGGGGGH